MVTLYTLICPLTHEIRYVGVTKKPLQKRLWHHINESKKNTKTHKRAWIQSILKKKLSPIIRAEKTFNNLDDALKAEIDLIAKLRAMQIRLTNITNGGEGTSGVKFSEERKKRHSQILKGLHRRLTPEHRQIISKRWQNNKFGLGAKRTKKQKEFLKQLRGIPIVQCRKDAGARIQEFSSCMDASRKLSILRTSIVNCLSGKTKSAGGYLWIYKK